MHKLQMWLVLQKLLLLFLIIGISISFTVGQSVTFYENYFTEGKGLHFSNIRGCTPIPKKWENRISSLDTHGNCLVFYDTSICKGRYLQVRLTENEPRIIPHLKRLDWNDAIKSFKPCEIKHLLRPGRYQIQNVENGMYLTIRNFRLVGIPILDPKAQQKGYRRFSQRWEIKESDDATGNYFYISSISLTGTPFRHGKTIESEEPQEKNNRELWDLKHVFGDISMIKNRETKECLGMKSTGEVFQSRCNRASKKQQWIFYDPEFQFL